MVMFSSKMCHIDRNIVCSREKAKYDEKTVFSRCFPSKNKKIKSPGSGPFFSVGRKTGNKGFCLGLSCTFGERTLF